MPTPFPGMNPYLEKPALWKQVHISLIVDIQRYLAPRVRPKYQVAIEQRNFLSFAAGDPLVGEPDVLVVAPAGRPVWNWHEQRRLLMVPTRLNCLNPSRSLSNYSSSGARHWSADHRIDKPFLTSAAHLSSYAIERYLEVRDAGSGEVIAVIEILSPSNKLEDRRRYLRKRQQVLDSMTNLVEIDLLRIGKPMPMMGEFPKTAYRLLVSRALQRPETQVFPCGLR